MIFIFSYIVAMSDYKIVALQEHHRSQREQWEIRQLDNDLLHQRHSEREREREEKELAEQQLLLADERDDFNLQST
jgi:hypothetical protein